MNRADFNESELARQMRLHRQHRDVTAAMESMSAFARDNGDDDDGDADDEEGDDSSDFVKSIRTVTLEPARTAEFESFFFPKKERNFLVPILESLSDVTANINMFFRFMRLVMAKANYLSYFDQEQVAHEISKIHVDLFQSKRSSGSTEADVVSFLRASRRTSSAFHNVYRSKRYNEGLDFVLMGAGADPEEEGLPAPYFGVEDSKIDTASKLPHDNQNPITAERRRGQWQSPIGEKILAAAREIHMMLFGTLAVSDRMIHRGIPLTTKFSDIEAIWVKHTGIKLPTAGEIVTDIVVTNPFAEQFLQVEVIKQPSKRVKDIVKTARQNNIEAERYNASSQRWGNTTNLREVHSRDAMNQRVNEMLNGENPRTTPEAELLNLTLRTSLRFTLESDVAHFVTQTPEAERPSMTRANSWFSLYIAQVLRAKVTGTGKAYTITNTKAINMDHIPRYATSASTLKKIPALREQNGFVVEKTKGNAENMYILPNGTMGVRPSVDVLKDTTLAEDFEKASEDLLEMLGRLEIPLAAFQMDSSPEQWPWIDESDIERLNQMMAKLAEFDGCSLGFDWDFGVNIQATSTPGLTNTSVSIGSVTPDSLAIADWLGFNMAKDGEQPVKRTFAQAMYTLNHHEHTAYAYKEAEEVYGAAADSAKFAKTAVVDNIINLYMRLAYADNKAPKLDDLLKSALRALNYEELPTEQGFDFSMDYQKHMNTKGEIYPRFKGNIKGIILNLLEVTLDMASGAQGTHLWNEVFDSLKSGDKNPRAADVSLELENNENYFNSSVSTTAEFVRCYKYFGGQVFKQILDAINAVDIGHFANARKGSSTVDMGANDQYPDKRVTMTVTAQPNAVLYKDVLPFAVMLGKYAPNSETIFAEAQEQIESIQPDPSFNSDDIKVPGLVDEARAIFPHQENVQSSLRKKNPPTFAILALAPGGGKTSQGTIDIACLMKDMKETGTIVRPLVICPNGLINTWCEEIRYFLGSNWNAFPISSDVMARWSKTPGMGEKALADLAKNAPPNTIFISSMTFIQGRNTRVCIGSAQVNFSQNLEFLRRLGSNYVAIDESHNLKSFKSARHRATKILTSSTTVKWLRLLTGTVMPDRAKDIEAQIALKAPHVFRAGDIANIKPNEEAAAVKIGDRFVQTYQPLNGKRAVDKLGHYISFIVKEKKDWAYMLPSAIESFHPVPMVDFNGADGTSAAEIEQQKLHEQLYRLVLDKTLQELKPLLAQKAKAEKAAAKDNNSNDDDEDDDNGSGGGNNVVDNDSDFAGEAISQKMWERHLARFERLIICPQEDDAFEEVFGDMAEGFVSRKAKYIANLAAKHFNPPKWKRGNRYIELDLVDFDGQLFVAKKYNPGETRVSLPDDVMSKTPLEAPDYWKPEPKGKLIIITRYNASARAVYDALPPNYRAMAVKFTGDEPDRVKAFNDFKTDDRIQILIANEQGMSEGHNLQLASRMIRAEAPWGPGALAQTSARVWRPDAKGAMAAAAGTGTLTRDVVYLDWVLADNTMEVAKLARVISKTFGIARITEASNPLYAELLASVRVPTEKEDARLALSIDMLANAAGLDDKPFSQMEDAYRRLNRVESKEFAEMRAKNKIEMLPIEKAAPMEGAARMDVVPFVANQPIPDPNNWGLQNVEVMVRDPEVFNNFRDKLRLKPVVTEWGTGKIVGFNTRGGKLSSLTVNLKNPPAGMPSRVTVQLNMAYIAQRNITPDQEERFFDVNTASTATEETRDAARAKRLEKQEQKQREIEEREERIRKKQETERLRVIKKEKEDGDKREENEKKGKPINEGIYNTGGTVKVVGGKVKPKVQPKPAAVPAPVEEDEDFPEEIEESSVSLYPMYYHGFATLEAQFDEGELDLKGVGFQHVPAYAYIDVNNKKKFHVIYDWIYDNFELSAATNRIFEQINDAFEVGMKNTHKLWYNLELAPVSELPAFFMVNKRMNSNRRALRVFPIFTEEHVRLCVDIRTNPGILKQIGKPIPNAGVKWQKVDGEWLYFGKNKTDLKQKIAEVARSVTVNNKDMALKELADINFKYKTR